MKGKSILKMWLAVSVFSLAVTGVVRADWLEIDKLLASDGASGDRFGKSVSISGENVIVGASYDYNQVADSGSAYIFKRDGMAWIQQAKLKALDGYSYDYFGCCVSIDGKYAIVGACQDDDNDLNSGSAYIFKRYGTDWIQQVKLLASDGSASDYFGQNVSIDGEYAIVGAYCDDDDGLNSGSAYVFRRNGTAWIQQAKLKSSDAYNNDCFGISVSIDGEYAIIGAYLDDDNGLDSGSAYVFKRDDTTWVQQAKLTASDGYDKDLFGYTVSIDGEYAIVGAHQDDDNGFQSGSAYIFKRDGTAWSQQDKLISSDGYIFGSFGYHVSIDGEYAIVGAYQNDDNGIASGSAYIFRREGEVWIQHAKLTSSDGADLDWFGRSVSISSDYAIVGAWGNDDNGTDSGSAYIYTWCPDWDWTGDCFVDLGDFAVLGEAWLSEAGDLNWNAECDISVLSDGVIDEMDLSVFVSDWLEGVY